MTRSSPNRLRIGVLGAAKIARLFIEAVRPSRKVVVTAVASRDAARAKSFMNDTGIARVHPSYEALLADSEIDAVYVPLPNNLHAEWSIRAVRAGKHVLCEKPLAMNARDCEEMLRAAEASGRLLAEAFMYRHHPQIARVQELVRSEAIGQVMAVEASFRFPLTNVDDVRMNAEWGGGALLDVGCYCVSASRLFLGDSPVGMTALAAYHPVKKVDTSLQGVLDYGSGRYAIISCGFDSGVHQKVVLCGTMGTIELSQPFKSWTGRPQITMRAGEREEVIALDAVNTFQLEVDDLATAIIEGGAPRADAADALLNMRILDRLAATARG